MDSHFKKIRFEQEAGDPCLYMASEGEMFLFAVYVDDILLAGKGNERLTAVKLTLSEKFQVKDFGRVAILPGSEGHTRSHEWKCLDWIGVVHREYIKKIWYGRCRDRTPVETSTKLVKGGDEDIYMDQPLYQSAVGSLLYLSTVMQ